MKKLQEKDYEMGKIVSENLRMLCATKLKKADKPKTEIANRCGVAGSAVTKWVDGRIVPSVVHLMTIADYFGVSLEWLVTKHDFGNLDVAQLVRDAVYNATASVDATNVLLNAVEKGE